jgi:hypothetical protein
MARGNVLFQDERLRASVSETRIYFPATDGSEPNPAGGPLDRGRDIALVGATDADAAVRPQQAAISNPAGLSTANTLIKIDPEMATPPTYLPRLSRQATAHPPLPQSARGTDITAATMILQLLTAAPAASQADFNASRPAHAPTYRVKTIDLDGGVVIEEAEWQQTPAATAASAFPAIPNNAPNGSTFEPRYRLLGQRVVGQAAVAPATEPGVTRADSARLGRDTPSTWAEPAQDNARLAAPGSEALVWTIHGPASQPARLLTPEAELSSIELHFDQARQLTWTNRAGVVQFDLPSSETPKQAPQENPPTRLPSAATTTAQRNGPPGRGSATWQEQMQFNGQDLALDGHVKLDLQRPAAAGQQESLQAHAARLTLELTQPVRLDGLSGQEPSAPGQPIAAKRLRLYADAPTATTAADPHVRIYRQGKDAAGALLQQEVIWSQEVELSLDEDQFRLRGPGTVWSLRPGSTSTDQPPAANPNSLHLSFLKVQFQREMNGNWTAGQVDVLGPVAAVYGKADDWQIMDNENRLLSPIKITSNQMTLNRWQPTPNSTYELEWEASGRVHVLGEDFEGTAQQINYAQQQDLLTLRGDSRAPAKFWQITTTNGQRNHLAADKIWYRPDREDFHFEGFQEGNLNFFSGRRGATPADSASQ